MSEDEARFRQRLEALHEQNDDLQAQLKNQRTFLSMVIHELKHPIEQVSHLHTSQKKKLLKALNNHKFMQQKIQNGLEDSNLPSNIADQNEQEGSLTLHDVQLD